MTKRHPRRTDEEWRNLIQECRTSGLEYKGANNRSYYGIYHAISAIQALDERAYKRHKVGQFPFFHVQNPS